jgi:uncharacterized protein YndB with AHSA1/START domain
VYRLFFIPVLPFRLRENSSFPWLSFSGAGQTFKNIAHYGRFTAVERPNRLQHTWVSPNTLGLESNVTVTFEKQDKGTRMTLVHADLPDDDKGRSHEKGWNFFLAMFLEQFGK